MKIVHTILSPFLLQQHKKYLTESADVRQRVHRSSTSFQYVKMKIL